MTTPDVSANKTIIATSEGRQFALVVGANNSAKSPYLKSLLYAERDAYAMADILRKPECNFTVLEPPLIGKEAHTMAIKEAVADLVSKGAYQDFLLFYFSGHAKRMRIDENKEDVYFITHDFEEKKVQVMPDLYLSMSWLWKIFHRQAEASKILLILDCCYAGKMIGAGNNPYQIDIREIVDQYLNDANIDKYQDRLRLILMATREDTTALEKDGHGFMTYLLLRALRGEVREVLDNEGRVDAAFLIEYLKGKMRAHPPILWIEGNSQPCILAHYHKQSARLLKEAERDKEDTLIFRSSEITSRDFFENRTQVAYGPLTLPFDHLTPLDASLADLDLATVTDFFKRDLVRRQQDFRAGILDQDQLVNFDFLHTSHPTYGALLCFGQNPQKWLSGSLTRCIHWPGDTRHDGWLNDQEIRGPLLKQFELCLDFLRKSLRFSRLINQEGRSEKYEIPFVALEEALANALIHREYMNRTDFVQVEVFDDRIEFRSPGDLPTHMTMDLLGVENKCHPRNPQIARIFYLHGYVERVGSGIQRMQHVMKEAGLPSPKFELSEAKTFTVTLHRPQQILVPIPNEMVNVDEPVAQEGQSENIHREMVMSSVQSTSPKEDEGKIDRLLNTEHTSTVRFGFGIKRICPSCFKEIYLGECRIISGRTSGKVLKNPSKGLLSRIRVEPLIGPKYTLELARRECPECGYLLPPNVESAPSINLVVLGDVFSGKSHYITALIHQLQTEWMSNSTSFMRLECLTPDVEKTYIGNYFEPFLTNHQTLAPTQRAMSPYANPLIYKLAVSQSPRHPTTVTNLMIYDASGEDFLAESRVVNFARFVLNTSAFIFIVDPVAITPIFRELPSTLQADLQRQFIIGQRRRPAESLNSIISIYERYRGYQVGSHLKDIPIGIMISKSDLFKFCDMPGTYNFMVHPHYGDSIDLQDIETIDHEVRELLRKYQQGDLLQATSRFEQVKFFATSATGEPPDVNGQFKHVEPYRCLDPLLWILHQLGIVKASK